MAKTRIEKGKSIAAFPGVVDTWNWLVDSFVNMVGDGKYIDVEWTSENQPRVKWIGPDPSAKSGDGGGGGGDNDDTPETPEVPQLDTSGYADLMSAPEYISGDYSNIVFTPEEDASGEETGRIKIDVYYV